MTIITTVVKTLVMPRLLKILTTNKNNNDSVGVFLVMILLSMLCILVRGESKLSATCLVIGGHACQYNSVGAM